MTALLHIWDCRIYIINSFHTITVTHLSLQSNGIEGLVSLNDPDEQVDPCTGAERAANLGHDSNAAYKAQCAPASVLLPRHQPVGVTA